MSDLGTIYVVDDDPSILRSLSRLLNAAGYTVETSSSAEEFLRRNNIDGSRCLILDLQMPGINGLELQRTLAKTGKRIPIVFVSGYGEVPDSVQAMKDGAVDFLSKPYDSADLLSAVERAVSTGRVLRKAQLREQRARARLRRLTPREREVLRWVIAGRLNKQIASKLGISEKTIKVHRGRVMEKMRAESVVDLVHFVAEAAETPRRTARAY